MKKAQSNIELHGSIWMSVGKNNLGGKGRIELLSEIAGSGSISQAAKNMKMSYKAAWDAIDIMNNLAGSPLVERLTGGKGGGGTRLTPRGEQLIRNFKKIEEEHNKFISFLDSHSGGMADDFILTRRIGMKTSARNQFFGKIVSVNHGAVNDEIVLETSGRQNIVAIITHSSTLDLGLTQGVEAFALVKASSVILALDEGKTKFSARNCLSGTISRIQPGAVNTEVVIGLPGGGSVAAIITNESSENMGLKMETKVLAVFKASSVIIALPA